jgi:hypothetical protein
MIGDDILLYVERMNESTHIITVGKSSRTVGRKVQYMQSKYEH